MLMNSGTDSSLSVSCLWQVNNTAYAMNYGHIMKDKDMLLFLKLPCQPECALGCPLTMDFHLQIEAECWASRRCKWLGGNQIVSQCANDGAPCKCLWCDECVAISAISGFLNMLLSMCGGETKKKNPRKE